MFRQRSRREEAQSVRIIVRYALHPLSFLTVGRKSALGARSLGLFLSKTLNP